ncbi:50S ribosomal protein L22 [bacterium]|nr:MAG: 50S ribosomal protein L22 [bacterium]
MIEGRTYQRFVRMSPMKARRVVELVKGKSVPEALAILEFLPQKPAKILKKAIEHAVANAINKAGEIRVKPEDFYVKDLRVDRGPMYKRIRPWSMGRAVIIRKRTSHITVVVEEKEGKERR